MRSQRIYWFLTYLHAFPIMDQKWILSGRIGIVRVEGLEPTHLAALDPKSSVSTNFTTPAFQNRGANI